MKKSFTASVQLHLSDHISTYEMIFLDKKEMEASFEKLSDHRLASNWKKKSPFPEGENISFVLLLCNDV